MPLWIRTCALGAAALTGVELLLVVVKTYGRSLTFSESWRQILVVGAIIAVTSFICAASGALMGKVARLIVRARASSDSGAAPRTLGFFVAAISAPAIAIVLWLLTSGRRVRELPYRALWVTIATMLAAAVAGRLATELYRRVNGTGRERRPLAAVGLFLFSVASLVTDAFVLPRLYPAFHWSLAFLSVISMLSAAALTLVDTPRGRRTFAVRMPFHIGARTQLAAAAVALAALTPLSLFLLSRSPSAWISVSQTAPVSGKVVGLAGELALEPVQSRFDNDAISTPTVTPPPRMDPGIDLRGRDVLLITVDALRADRVTAYGGKGLTPNIDALASQSVVFLHAYTSAPHTFYAMGSIMTGEYLRSAVVLTTSGVRRVTLPELLQRNGYRTAAFYPPAVSSAERLAINELTDRHFGFESFNIGYATAFDRVKELDDYLGKQPATARLFVWIHIFEPHEPYTPPEKYIRGRDDRQLYDGEVMAADEAVGALVSRFRRDRPLATVIITADHGEEFREHGGYFHGTTLYDEQVRVPLIWSSPAQSKPATVHTAVDTVDITATLLSALGIAREPRMQSDDLGGLLRGVSDTNANFAYSEIGELRMVTDGRYKAIFTARSSIVELYDLSTDPGEKHAIGVEHPEIVKRLRGALAQHLSRTAHLCAAATKQQTEWPEALTRARLGDVSAGPDLAPLLGSPRADVRAAAARACGDLGYQPALPVLARMRERDDDSAREEAAIAALWLGDKGAQTQVLAMVKEAKKNPKGANIELARRAALALSKVDNAAGSSLLIALAEDAAASIVDRKRAIAALGALGARSGVRALCALLADRYLRIDAANALGDIGDKRAIRTLKKQLSVEPYEPAREAEIRALIKLGVRPVQRRDQPL